MLFALKQIYNFRMTSLSYLAIQFQMLSQVPSLCPAQMDSFGPLALNTISKLTSLLFHMSNCMLDIPYEYLISIWTAQNANTEHLAYTTLTLLLSSLHNPVVFHFTQHRT